MAYPSIDLSPDVTDLSEYDRSLPPGLAALMEADITGRPYSQVTFPPICWARKTSTNWPDFSARRRFTPTSSLSEWIQEWK